MWPLIDNAAGVLLGCAVWLACSVLLGILALRWAGRQAVVTWCMDEQDKAPARHDKETEKIPA